MRDYSPNWQRKRLSARSQNAFRVTRRVLELTICYSSFPASEDRSVNGCGGKCVEPEIDDVEPDAPLDDVVEFDQQPGKRCGFQSDQRRCKHRADGHVLVHEEKFGVV